VKVAQEKLPVGAKNVTVTVKTAPQGNGYKITNTSGIRSSTGGALKDNSGNNIPASAAQGSGTLALTSDGQYCEATFTVPIP
ncbi:hypothetical protein, partial [Acinetobacter baumannii]|uniref:hypothetical protein n=1 Tax=Acinetobacter baumannii TaxID=470 RepID=UPI00148A0E52